MTRAHKKRAAIAVTALVAAPLALVTTTSTPATAGDAPVATSMAVSWQRTALRTIFTETVPTPAPPVISVYLSFTSLAVYDAAREAQRGGGTPAAAAAVAQAAHDVLWEYFPASRANLDADLTASLALIKDGRKEDRGVAIGAAAADRMIASRVGDGRNDASVVYAKPAPGCLAACAGRRDGPRLARVPQAGRRRPGRPARRARSARQRGVRRRLQRGQARRLDDVADDGRPHGRADGDLEVLQQQRDRALPRRADPLPRGRADGPAAHDPALRAHRRGPGRPASSRPGG